MESRLRVAQIVHPRQQTTENRSTRQPPVSGPRSGALGGNRLCSRDSPTVSHAHACRSCP